MPVTGLELWHVQLGAPMSVSRNSLACGDIPASVRYSSKDLLLTPLDACAAGTIATVLKKSGEQVSENETIAQVETDKVTIDIKAPSDGTILGVVVQEQDTVVPGQLVATLDDSAAQVSMHRVTEQNHTTAIC